MTQNHQTAAEHLLTEARPHEYIPEIQVEATSALAHAVLALVAEAKQMNNHLETIAVKLEGIDETLLRNL